MMWPWSHEDLGRAPRPDWCLVQRLGDKETIMDLESKVTSAAAAMPAVPQVSVSLRCLGCDSG